MANVKAGFEPRQHLTTLHNYALGPLNEATEIAERERREVDQERDAFDAFESRVDQIAVVSGSTAGFPAPLGIDTSHGEPTRKLRRAYRDTVMAVDHYDDVYGHSLDVDVTREFGPTISALFQPRSDIPITAHHKRLLLDAVRRSRHERASFRDLVDTEVESVRSTYRDLSKVLETLDNSVMPTWYRAQFEADLDEIQSARQETLYERSLPASFDGHTLCDYLYADESWTYPGLTAVARVLESVDYR